jgi:hypothetical protein
VLNRRALFGWFAAVPLAVQEVVKNPPWAAQEIGGAQVGTLAKVQGVGEVEAYSPMVQGQFTGFGTVIANIPISVGQQSRKC